ncbi:MAG: TlpA disulfide reductase family protein [Chitinophagaceae bacterium]
MKKTVTLLLLALPCLLAAQEGAYTVSGTIGRLNAPAKIWLAYKKDGKRMLDSSGLVNGKFSFKGTTDDPFIATLVLDYKGIGLNQKEKYDNLKLYVSKGVTSVKSGDSLSKGKVAGSPVNNDYLRLMAMTKPPLDSMEALENSIKQAPPEKKSDPAYKARNQQLLNKWALDRKLLYRQFYRENKGSYIGLVALYDYAGSDPKPAELQPMFDSLTSAVKSTKAGQDFQTLLDNVLLLKPGAIAPDFTMADPSGKMISLAGFKGQYVLLDFWASWCGPCRAENPNVVAVYNRYKDKGFAVLGISLDKSDGRNEWLKAIKDDGLTWTQVSDLRGWDNTVAKLYGVRAIPQNFLIDPQGKIIAMKLEGTQLNQYLDKIFSQ